MHMTLDSHSTRQIGLTAGGSFTIGITHKDNYMGIIDSGIFAEPGSHTIVKITPSKVESTERFDKMLPEERECRLRSDNPKKDTLFRYVPTWLD